MTTRRRTSRRTSASRSRRKYQWVGFQTDETIALSASVNSQTTLGLYTPDLDDQGKTLMRIIYDLHVIPPNTTGDYPFTFGIMMVDADAVAAGATPDPMTDLADPWLIWRQAHIAMHANTGPYQAGGLAGMPGDVKARRRITASSDVLAIFESGGMTASVDITMGGRILLALP